MSGKNYRSGKHTASKGLRSSNIQGQEEIATIVGRKGRKKLKKIKCYGLQTHFRTEVLLKIGLMGAMNCSEQVDSLQLCLPRLPS